MTVLFISPVPKVSAQGRDKQTYSFYDSTIGQVKSSGKLIGNTRAKDAQVVLKFTPNFDTLEYKTGLDEKILNPYKGNTEMGFPENIVNQEYITLQTFYEIQDGVPFGTYTSKMKSNANIFNFSFLNKNAVLPEVTFIENFQLTLYDRVNRFDDTTARGRFAILLLKNHPRIAASKQVMNPVVHQFYISSENEAVEEQRKKQDLIDTATFEKVSLFRNTSEFKTYQVAVLCTQKDSTPIVKGNANFETCKERISSFLSEGRQQKENIEKFLNIVELSKNKNEKARFEIKYLIQQAFNTDIFTSRDGYIWWLSKASTPNMGKHADLQKLENILLTEYLAFNPEADVTNWYSELLKELIAKKVRIE